MRAAFLVVALGSLVLACGGSDPVTIGTEDAGADSAADVAVDAAIDAPIDPNYGAPSSTYPAFTPWMGQLAKFSGPILTNPIIVTVTWDGDPSRQAFEDFGDGIGGTSYFADAVGEYGVGPATSGTANHVHIATAPPASMNDTQARQFIQSNIGTLLPAWTDQTIYELYLPKATNLIVGNQGACQAGIGGYHDSFDNNGKAVIYAVLPRCSTEDKVTSASSHEICEAVTDPLPRANPAIRSFVDEFLAFELWQRNNDENGDACEFFRDSFYTEVAPFPFAVQRMWSNKQGPLGHSPCQPFKTAYWNVVPFDLVDVTVQNGNGTVKAKGYKAKLGDTIKIPIGLYSDQATAPWTLTASESNPVVNPVTGRLTVSIDPKKTSGVNGEKTFVVVTVVAEGPQKVELLTVTSTLDGVKHYLPLLIANQ